MYEIRPAAPGDAAIITLHRHRMFADMGRDETTLAPMTAAFLPWVREALERGTYLGVFATVADTVAAGAGLMLLEWPPHPNDPQPLRAYLLNVYTEPLHRRRGLARTLVNALVDEARLRGIRVIGLHASSEGRALYESLGFQTSNEMLRVEPR